jgi:hypothetical protein
MRILKPFHRRVWACFRGVHDDASMYLLYIIWFPLFLLVYSVLSLTETKRDSSLSSLFYEETELS